VTFLNPFVRAGPSKCIHILLTHVIILIIHHRYRARGHSVSAKGPGLMFFCGWLCCLFL